MPRKRIAQRTTKRAKEKAAVLPPHGPASPTPPGPTATLALATAPEPPPNSKKEESFSFPRVTIDRGDDVVIEIELCHGNITETPSKVILLGQVQGLDPTTAAISLDEAMNGALFRLLAQRNAGRGAGGLDIIPTGRHPIMAELIAFLSLGKWENFSEGSDASTANMLASSACSGLRSLLASSFDEFSTVLMGGRLPGHGEIDVRFSLRHMLRGFIEALREDPERDRFRRVVIVEQDIAVLRQILEVLRVLVQEEDFTGVRTTLCGSRLPVRTRTEGAARRAAALASRSNLLNLSLNPAGKNGGNSDLVALLQPGQQKGAVVLRRTAKLADTEIPELYDVIGVSTARGVTDPDQLAEVTRRVTGYLPPAFLAPLTGEAEPRIELVHDADASRVPWETLNLPDGRHPALLGGFSRRFVSDNARSLWTAMPAGRPRVLMIINPTGDLRGASAEGRKLQQKISGANLADITYLEGEDATKEKVTALLNGEVFDILHYAGHSVFKKENSKSSGLLLHGGEYFTGTDALGLARFPAVIVFNSCEAARIRRLDPVPGVEAVGKSLKKTVEDRDAAHGALSIAEAFLVAGVHHYIGTFWPVNDDAATLFATTLYTVLADHKTAGTAVTAARRALNGAQQPDWANYIHYGDPDAVVFPERS